MTALVTALAVEAVIAVVRFRRRAPIERMEVFGEEATGRRSEEAT